VRKALAISIVANCILIGCIIWSICASNDLRGKLSAANSELERSQVIIDRIGDIEARERGIANREAELARLDAEYIEREASLNRREAEITGREREAHSRIGNIIDDSLEILEGCRAGSE